MRSMLKLTARALRKTARIIDPPEKTQLIQDEYLTWLSYANSGMLEPGNPYLINTPFATFRVPRLFWKSVLFAGSRQTSLPISSENILPKIH